MCGQLIGQVKQLNKQQGEVINAVLTVSAETELMAGVVEVLKQKGLITNDEITEAVKTIKAKIQNAKSNKSDEHIESGNDRSEESGPDAKVHTNDSIEESEVSPTESE